MLPERPASGVTAETTVFDGSREHADAAVKQIITANLGSVTAEGRSQR
jgi:hypothetical protein